MRGEEFRIVEVALERTAQRRDVARRDHETIVAQDLLCAGRRRNDREPAGRGFEHAVGQRLRQRRQHKDVGFAIDPGEPAAIEMSEENDAPSAGHCL